MDKLSEKQVNNLNAAIDKTMDVIDETGCDPNAAIVKVAKDMKLTPDYLPVIVSAYNNGAQYAQRENGNTILEKTAKFPIADINKINSMLYRTEKKANSLYEVSDDFFDYPANVVLQEENVASRLLYSPHVKAASYRRENTTQFKKEAQVNDKVNTVVESIRMEKSAAADAYDDAISELAHYLRQVNAPSVPYATKLASMVYGNMGSMVIKTASDRFSLHDNKKYIEPVVSEKSELYKHCDNCINKLAEYNKICDQELELLNKCASALKPIVYKYTADLHKVSSKSNESPAYFFEKKKNVVEKTAESTKQAAPAKLFPEIGGYDELSRGRKLQYSDLSGLEALTRPHWRDLNEYEHNIMRSLDDPEQDSKLRDIVVKTNIIDLINTDEYLSDKDPEEVIDAYNELMEIAPEIHNKKPLLRAALRQYLESGGIDVQSLGLIGDIGRKTESREDAKKTELINQVQKMLEYDATSKAEARKTEFDLNKLKQQVDLTISEGRKQRSAQAEEARKQQSEDRKNNEVRMEAERQREQLRLADAEKGRQAQRDLETLRDALSRGRDRVNNRASYDTKYMERRDQSIADFIKKWTTPAQTVSTAAGLTRKGPLSITDINSLLSNFNTQDIATRRDIYNSYDALGLGASTGSHLTNKQTLFTVDPATGEVTLNDPAHYQDAQISDAELDTAARNYADRIRGILNS